MCRLRSVMIAATAFSLLELTLPSQAAAQVGAAGATRQPWAAPYQQRLSPYLDLLRVDNSVLSPYHTFVEPRRRIRQSLNLQAAQIGRLQEQVTRVPSGAQSTPAGRLPTGGGGTFNNYLHFYRFDRPVRTK